MITFTLARKLKKNGLRWKPAMHDFFAIPDRGMDQRVFVITDMLANLEKVLGAQVVAFQGASEWALDYLVTSEAVWMPTESQIRQALLQQLSLDEQTALVLACTPEKCTCRLTYDGQNLNFQDRIAAEAYGLALLHILGKSPPDEGDGDEDSDIWEAGLRGNQES